MLSKKQSDFIYYVVLRRIKPKAAGRLLNIKPTEILEWMNDDEFVLEWVANACLRDVRLCLKAGNKTKASVAGRAATGARNYLNRSHFPSSEKSRYKATKSTAIK